jgi:ABC-type Fe3+/spermidine/putrescine transport system ATPase subunit
MLLRIENLTKLYTPGEASGGIRDIGFEVAAGEFYTLLGPSGCGKTTTLRCVAGLEEPTAGRIALEDRVIFDSAVGTFLPANQRRLGMVFQSYAVWPHMSVFDNVAFPLRMARDRRWSRADIARRVARTLETMELSPFADRSAAQLSGGQQQRLALARALVAEPRLLLLDEPLSNLDAQLREHMRVELRRLQKEVGVAAVYVTHDQSEALALSDRIAVMNSGRIVQIGTPQQIYHQPRNAFVAGFVGRSNVLRGPLIERRGTGDGVRIDTAIGPVLCEAPAGAAGVTPGAVLIRPEHVVLAPAAGEPGPNRFHGTVLQTAFLGEGVESIVQVAGVNILVRSAAGLAESAGRVELYFPPARTLAIATGDP